MIRTTARHRDLNAHRTFFPSPFFLLLYLELQCMMQDMKIGKDLVAASAVPLILSILEEGESYGYAIIQRVRALSGGDLEWTDGMLYPVLHRLEAQGLIRSRWGLSESGRKRKYYAVKISGRKTLAEQKQQWQVVLAALNQLWGAQHA
jgi:PadR family transcriptional regulator, regulatory protein PadR